MGAFCKAYKVSKKYVNFSWEEFNLLEDCKKLDEIQVLYFESKKEKDEIVEKLHDFCESELAKKVRKLKVNQNYLIQ